jgi:hypothetical protein
MYPSRAFAMNALQEPGWVAQRGEDAGMGLGAKRREPAKRFAAAVSRVTLEEVRVNFDVRVSAFRAAGVRARRPAPAATRAGHTGPMSEPLCRARALAAEPCQSVCVWTRTEESVVVDPARDPATVFACAGCGSEWLRTELWTPIDADGHVPPEVAAELARRPTRGDG